MKCSDPVWRWLLGAGGWDGQVRRYWHHCYKIRLPWADQLTASVLAPLAVFISGGNNGTMEKWITKIFGTSYFTRTSLRLCGNLVFGQPAMTDNLRLYLSSFVPQSSSQNYRNWKFSNPNMMPILSGISKDRVHDHKSFLSCGKNYFCFLCTYHFHNKGFCLLLSKHSLSEISRNLTLRASGTGKVFLNDQDLTSMAQVFQDCKLGCWKLQYNNHQMMRRGWKSRLLSTQATFWLLGLTIWNQGLAERLTVIIIIIPIIGIIRENWKKGC